MVKSYQRVAFRQQHAGVRRAFSNYNDGGLSLPLCLIATLLISDTSAISLTAGGRTVSVADVTKADRVHLALVTVAETANNPTPFNLSCFESLMPDGNRDESVSHIQEIAARIEGLRDSISPLELGPITYRNIGVNGAAPNMRATADLCCLIDGYPATIPVTVQLEVRTISTRIVDMPDVIDALERLVDKSHDLARAMIDAGWTPRGESAHLTRSTTSPHLIKPKNIHDEHARMNATVSHARLDGVDSGGQPLSSGVYFARLVAGDYSATKKMAVVK